MKLSLDYTEEPKVTIETHLTRVGFTSIFF